MKYRIKKREVGGVTFYLVQVRRWWGWVTVRSYRAAHLYDDGNEWMNEVPDGPHAMGYTELCATELLEVLQAPI